MWGIYNNSSPSLLQSRSWRKTWVDWALRVQLLPWYMTVWWQCRWLNYAKCGLTEHLGPKLGGDAYTLQGEDKALFWQGGWERSQLFQGGMGPAENLAQVAFKHPPLLIVIVGWAVLETDMPGSAPPPAAHGHGGQSQALCRWMRASLRLCQGGNEFRL